MGGLPYEKTIVLDSMRIRSQDEARYLELVSHIINRFCYIQGPRSSGPSVIPFTHRYDSGISLCSEFSLALYKQCTLFPFELNFFAELGDIEFVMGNAWFVCCFTSKNLPIKWWGRSGCPPALRGLEMPE